jgi:hypothetical protein
VFSFTLSDREIDTDGHFSAALEKTRGITLKEGGFTAAT